MNDSSSRYTKQLIDQISQVFKDSKNPNNIDLIKLRDYIIKDKNLNDSHIFKRKLDDFRQFDTISRQQFQRKFNPDTTKKEHFDMIFDLIDKDRSGKISKRQLQLLNKQMGLNLTKYDIDLMMNFASKDGQKVFKEDLFKFINSS